MLRKGSDGTHHSSPLRAAERRDGDLWIGHGLRVAHRHEGDVEHVDLASRVLGLDTAHDEDLRQSGTCNRSEQELGGEGEEERMGTSSRATAVKML